MTLVSRSFAEYYRELVTRELTLDELLKRVCREETGARKRIETELAAAEDDLRHLMGIMAGERKKKAKEMDKLRSMDKHSLMLLEQETAVWLPSVSPRPIVPLKRRLFPGFPLTKYKELAKEEEELRYWLVCLEVRLRIPIEKAYADSLFLLACLRQCAEREVVSRDRVQSEENEEWVGIRRNMFRLAPPDYFRYLWIERYGVVTEVKEKTFVEEWQESREAMEQEEQDDWCSMLRWLFDMYGVQLFSVSRREVSERYEIEEEESEELWRKMLAISGSTFGQYVKYIGVVSWHVCGCPPILRKLALWEVEAETRRTDLQNELKNEELSVLHDISERPSYEELDISNGDKISNDWKEIGYTEEVGSTTENGAHQEVDTRLQDSPKKSSNAETKVVGEDAEHEVAEEDFRELEVEETIADTNIQKQEACLPETGISVTHEEDVQNIPSRIEASSEKEYVVELDTPESAPEEPAQGEVGAPEQQEEEAVQDIPPRIEASSEKEYVVELDTPESAPEEPAQGEVGAPEQQEEEAVQDIPPRIEASSEKEYVVELDTPESAPEEPAQGEVGAPEQQEEEAVQDIPPRIEASSEKEYVVGLDTPESAPEEPAQGEVGAPEQQEEEAVQDIPPRIEASSEKEYVVELDTPESAPEEPAQGEVGAPEQQEEEAVQEEEMAQLIGGLTVEGEETNGDFLRDNKSENSKKDPEELEEVSAIKVAEGGEEL